MKVAKTFRKLALVRELALAVPGMAETTSYGTPAFKLDGTLLLRLHQDGETLVLRCDPAERELMLQAAPELFFMTDHYEGSPFVLVRLAKVTRPKLSRMVRDAANLLPARGRRA